MGSRPMKRKKCVEWWYNLSLLFYVITQQLLKVWYSYCMKLLTMRWWVSLYRPSCWSLILLLCDGRLMSCSTACTSMSSFHIALVFWNFWSVVMSGKSLAKWRAKIHTLIVVCFVMLYTYCIGSVITHIVVEKYWFIPDKRFFLCLQVFIQQPASETIEDDVENLALSTRLWSTSCAVCWSFGILCNQVWIKYWRGTFYLHNSLHFFLWYVGTTNPLHCTCMFEVFCNNGPFYWGQSHVTLNVRWITNYSATVIAFNNKKGHLKYTTCSVSLNIPYFEYIIPEILILYCYWYWKKQLVIALPLLWVGHSQ